MFCYQLSSHEITIVQQFFVKLKLAGRRRSVAVSLHSFQSLNFLSMYVAGTEDLFNWFGS